MSVFDRSSHLHDQRRLNLLRVAEAALEAIDPEQAVRRVLKRDGSTIICNDIRLDLAQFERAVILGFGKASVPMGRAIADIVSDLDVSGVVVTNAPADAGPLEVVEGSHPVPDQRSVEGTHRILQAANGVRETDLVVVAISGGGSALLAAPDGQLTLQHLQEMTSLLLRCGAEINELNTVRKHLSAVKGGRLGQAVAGAGAIVTLIMSDVIGNPLDVIASGPTMPDPTTFHDALAILDRYKLRGVAPHPVVEHLEAGAAGAISETPADEAIVERQLVALIADAEVAAMAAVIAAQSEGWVVRIATTELQGEARTVAEDLVEAATELDPGTMLVYAGETTVTVVGDGRGGRNQELALAASVALDGRDDIILLSIGTDGIDGRSDAAGAFGSGTGIQRGHLVGLDGVEHLNRNDSNTFLTAIGDVIRSGPTGTNVGDLVLVARTG